MTLTKYYCYHDDKGPVCLIDYIQGEQQVTYKVI